MSMYGTSTMNITKLYVQRTGTYEDQWQRPYVTEMNLQSQNALVDALGGVKCITPTAIAKAMESTDRGFITQRAEPEKKVDIVNGWQTPRLRYLMEVVVVDNMGVTKTMHITGHTEHGDTGYTGSIDPNMRFTINNISQTKTVTYRTPSLGTQSYQNLINSSHLLVNPQYQSLYDRTKVYSLSPESVLDDIDNIDLAQQAGDSFISDGTIVSSVPIKADRKNNVPGVYMAGIMDGYLQTSRGQAFDSQSEILESAKAVVGGQTYTSDPFLMRLQALRGARGYGQALADTFSMSELLQIDPSVRVRVVDYQAGGVHQAGQTVGWGGSDGVTQCAATLAQALPAYMTQFCFNSIHITSTNHTRTGEIATTINNANGYNNALDRSKEISALVYRLNTELFHSLSFGNRMPFEIEVICDLIGETWLDISLNSGAMMSYMIPSFADALMAPMITSNINTLHGISNDFNMLMTELVEADAQDRNGAINGTSQFFI